MHLVLGFDSVKGHENPDVLYCGTDRDKVLELIANPPKGPARLDIFSHPRPTQRKFLVDPAAAPAPKKVAKKAAKKAASGEE